jgi:endonuclease VIII
LPEGDTIRRTAEALRQRLAGKTVTEARPRSIARLKGRCVEGVEPTGKHLIIRFEGGIALHSHMGMTGSWHVYRSGEHWRKPAWSATVVLGFDDEVAVCFAAPTMELVADSKQSVAHLGPDILGEPFDVETVLKRARAAEAGTIGELLLDQRVCAGIGNIYKCETLWIHRQDPWESPARIDERLLGQLYLTARQLMRAALIEPAGRQRHAVHGRGGRACPRCGTRIRIRSQGRLARLTYYCPRCQGEATTRQVAGKAGAQKRP